MDSEVVLQFMYETNLLEVFSLYANNPKQMLPMMSGGINRNLFKDK